MIILTAILTPKKKKKPLTHIFLHPSCLQLKIVKGYIVEQGA